MRAGTEHTQIGLIAVSFTLASFYLGPAINIPLLLYSVFFLLIALCCRLFPLFEGADYKITYPHALAFLSLLWGGISIYWSRLPENSFHFFFVYSTFPLVLFCLVNESGKSWRKLINFLLLPLVASACWGIGEFLVTLRRANGPYIDPNLWAAILNMVYFGLLSQFLRSGKLSFSKLLTRKSGSFLILIMFVIAIALFCSYSRTGTAVHYVALAFIVVLGLLRQVHRSKVLIALTVSLLSFTLVHGIASQEDASDPEGYTLDINKVGWSQRISLWSSTVDIYLDHPVLGSGYATFRPLYRQYRTTGDLYTAGNFAHNDYLQMLAEGGPVQLGFICFFVGYLIYWLWVYSKNYLTGHLTGPMTGKISSRSIEPLVLIVAMGTALTHALMSFIILQISILMIMAVYFARLVKLNRHQSFGLSAAANPFRLKLGVSIIVIALWSFLLLDSISYQLVFGQKGLPIPERMLKDYHSYNNLFRILGKVRTGNSTNHSVLARQYLDRLKIESVKTGEAADKGLMINLILDTAVEFEKAIESNPFDYTSMISYSTLLEKNAWLRQKKDVNYTVEVLLDMAVEAAPVFVEPYLWKARYLENQGKSREAYHLLLQTIPYMDIRYNNYQDVRLNLLRSLSRMASRFDDPKVLKSVLYKLENMGKPLTLK